MLGLNGNGQHVPPSRPFDAVPVVAVQLIYVAQKHGEEATVSIHGHLVGHLSSSGGTHRFEIADEYLETPRRPLLGQVFEEHPTRQWQEGSDLPRWFSNLLPEHAKLRQLIAKQHGINPRNEFRLLMPLGSDLPGAIQVRSSPSGPSAQTLKNGMNHGGESARTTESADLAGIGRRFPVRFSVAGVQLKLSMMWSGNTLILPGEGEFADHLVKLPSRQYANLVENEYSMMRWASEVGIDVPECEVRPAEDLGPLPEGFGELEGATVYVVRRFDRGPYRSIQDEHIHMEDLNQVVDNKPGDKYKGVSFERLGRIILALCGEDDLLEYVRRLTFCIAIGNEDAHLKNWTIWYPDRIRPRLSPSYDLVSTIQYPELDRKMALKLGRSRDPTRLDLDTMKRLADRTAVDPLRVTETVRRTLESMRDSWTGIGRDLPVGRNFRNRLRDYQRKVPLLRPFSI